MLGINERATRLKAKQVLKAYPSFKRLADRNIEADVTRDAVKHSTAVEEAINQMDDNVYKFILENQYIKGFKAIDIQRHAGIRSTTYYNNQSEALLLFAELYSLEDLIVMERD